MKINSHYDKDKNKSIFFFSASAVKSVELLFERGIREILVSYFYIRKRPGFFKEFLPALKEAGGTFMTDSGGFSFIGWGHGNIGDGLMDADGWQPYVDEYIQWLHDNLQYVDVLVNLDLDSIVGRDVVDMWNEKYFDPFIKMGKEVCFVSHTDTTGYYGDKTGMKRLKEYADQYDYLGVNREMSDSVTRIASLAVSKKKRIHGFGWTSIPTLRSYPFFSVDSTTWLGGARYGTSYMFDGKNFRVNDFKKKHYRKTDKVLCQYNDIDYDLLLEENETEVNKFNLLGWIGARNEYLKIANLKLRNFPVSYYLK